MSAVGLAVHAEHEVVRLAELLFRHGCACEIGRGGALEHLPGNGPQHKRGEHRQRPFPCGARKRFSPEKAKQPQQSERDEHDQQPWA